MRRAKINVKLEKYDIYPAEFPDVAQLLVSGGDARIALDPETGLNKYGCRPYPDSELLAFGSSTASTISQDGFIAASRVRDELLAARINGGFDACCLSQMQRIRQALLAELQLTNLNVLLQFAASGTDAHCVAADYARGAQPLRVVMVEEEETGSGVKAALLAVGCAIDLVALRESGGVPRAVEEINSEVSARVDASIGRGERVLLVMVDQSKTGLVAPGVACLMRLVQQYADRFWVMVDACQFRLSPYTLRAYLQQGFMVAITGSKFFTGPSFSAALLLPAGLQKKEVSDSAFLGVGLLLRWEAALVELRRFHAVPQVVIVEFLTAFNEAVGARLAQDDRFEPLAVTLQDRSGLQHVPSWDHLPTIFPFLLKGREGWLDREQTRQVYRQLQVPDLHAPRCQFGQPVVCGMRDGVPVSALRLCISARQISDAAAQHSISALIADALSALDGAAALI
ncbi:MAG TPA: hypothetical protein DE312_08675 [Gallionella sp.]|nr:MAG: hypothetical protein A2Z87_09505 [Gallionellales bacterium GWA2_54_124]HCI53368.1 hypothetical protein [Gallionella sp.]